MRIGGGKEKIQGQREKKKNEEEINVCTKDLYLFGNSQILSSSHLVFEALLDWKSDTVCYQLLGRV